MDFDIVNTPCPGYKTLKRSYTILAFPRVNMKLTQKQNMIKQEKIFCNIELTKNDIFLFKVINRDVSIAQPGQDMFPNKETIKGTERASPIYTLFHR